MWRSCFVHLPNPRQVIDTAIAAAPCGIDTVRIERVERLLEGATDEELLRLFSATELADAGAGRSRSASLAARFAAKEACLKLFPRETSLQLLDPGDFSVRRDNYGAPLIECSRRARIVLGRHRISKIAVSLTHDAERACAVAMIERRPLPKQGAGNFFLRWLPFRRDIVIANLQRVFGGRIPPADIEQLAAAHYGHLWRLIVEFLTFPFLRDATKTEIACVENLDALLEAHAMGRGVLILTGHFGNFEIGTAAALRQFPEAHGRFYFLRRPFKPRWLDSYITHRFRKAGFGVLPKRGSLDWLLERLGAGDLVVFPFDQHAAGRDGIRVDFFGEPAATFRSLALVAEASGAPVVPASSWREPDGRHVLRFEAALPPFVGEDFGEQVKNNTRAYNEALEELVVNHPEQWWWTHRRWKPSKSAAKGNKLS